MSLTTPMKLRIQSHSRTTLALVTVAVALAGRPALIHAANPIIEGAVPNAAQQVLTLSGSNFGTKTPAVTLDLFPRVRMNFFHQPRWWPLYQQLGSDCSDLVKNSGVLGNFLQIVSNLVDPLDGSVNRSNVRLKVRS
jgi:hypothetical protein